MTEGPEEAVLEVQDLGGNRWTAPHPTEDPEKRDVLFSGQLIAQMMMVASTAAGTEKLVKSIHAVFARTGSYSGGPVQYVRDGMHAGRAWASDTVTAYQGDRLLARGLVLLDRPERDLMRHSPSMPDVPGPDECQPDEIPAVYPGSEVRPVDRPDARSSDGAPVSYHWVRPPATAGTVAETQAAVAWSQPGFTIATAMRPHRDAVRITDSHRKISTGVISHTSHFHDRALAGEWLLVVSTASFAGHGRVFGCGSVFTAGGTLVSTFGQDAMARHAEAPLDPTRSM